jgi:hypothetical protein
MSLDKLEEQKGRKIITKFFDKYGHETTPDKALTAEQLVFDEKTGRLISQHLFKSEKAPRDTPSIPDP